MERVIERHGKPSEYDQAPQGTVCIVKGKRYVQTSADEEHPKWIEIEC